MMDNDPNDLASRIPNGKHLTWVDVMRSKFHPEIDRDDLGKVTYPRRDFLTAAAAERKRALEAARKQGG
jgi:hypothetical protein